jgi:hypothetical protein
MAEDPQYRRDLLAEAAERAAERPEFFANVLARYAEIHAFTKQDLCAQLGCDLDTLIRLSLCATPDREPYAFQIDVRRVAEKLGLEPSVLATIVREVDAVEAFARSRERRQAPFSSTSGTGMLKAARDHDDEGPTDTTAPAQETDREESGEEGT